MPHPVAAFVLTCIVLSAVALGIGPIAAMTGRAFEVQAERITAASAPALVGWGN